MHPHPLYGALDRFAQFFIKPLFRPESLDRELKVIDAEYDKNLRDDHRRLSQLRRSLSNPAHPVCGFATGNWKTLRSDPHELGVDVGDELIKFYKSHYSANRMKLAILGRESLGQLEKWAIELFSEVPNRNLVQDQWDSKPLFTAGMQVFAKPIMDFHALSIDFPFLDEEGLYDTLPSQYIIHLLGYKGPGSILSYLKAKDWATKIVPYARAVCPGSAYFSIWIVLTKDGLTNYQEVVKLIFCYIGIIKERAPERWVFNELKNLAELRFQTKSNPAGEFTMYLSKTMLKSIPRERLLSYSVPKLFNAKIITNALSYLRDDNFRLMIVSQHSPCTWVEKEKWYGTEYKEENIPKDFLKEITDALSSRHDKIQMLRMPLKNEFVPHDLSVEKIEIIDPACAPKLIRCDKNARVWYKKDDRFWEPTASVKIILRTSGGWTPANYIKARLYCDLLIDRLEEGLSGAEQAGMRYKVDVNRIGLEVSMYGNNEKMLMLIKQVVSMMRSLTVDSERLITIKEHLTRAYRNANMDQPFRQATRLLRYLTEENIWMNDQYAAEIEYIKANDIEGFLLELQHNHIELLAHGNLRREEVLEMTDVVEKALHSRSLPQYQWHVRRDPIFESGSNYIYEHRLMDPSDVNNCIQYYLHIGSVDDDILRAQLILLQQICGEPALDRLRTKEQLGYIVESGVRYSATMGYFLLVQGKYAARYLERRIDAFLESFAQTLKVMTDEEFNIQKYSVINRLLAKVENMRSETESFWKHIKYEDLQFLQHETEATLIKNLSKTDFTDFYNQYINPISETRAKLSIRFTAHSAVNESTEALEFQPSSNREPEYIRDVGRFKAAQRLSRGLVSLTCLGIHVA